MKLPDWLRRGIRTFIQGATGTFIVLVVGPYAEPGYVPDLAWVQRVVASCVMGGVMGVVTSAHNALEDHTPFPSVLKAPASPGVDPVPDPGRRLELH